MFRVTTMPPCGVLCFCKRWRHKPLSYSCILVAVIVYFETSTVCSSLGWLHTWSFYNTSTSTALIHSPESFVYPLLCPNVVFPSPICRLRREPGARRSASETLLQNNSEWHKLHKSFTDLLPWWRRNKLSTRCSNWIWWGRYRRHQYRPKKPSIWPTNRMNSQTPRTRQLQVQYR